MTFHWTTGENERSCPKMEKGKQQETSFESIGLSQREFFTLFLLQTLSKEPNYPRAIHDELNVSFTGKVHSYDYLCKTARQLAASGHLELYAENGKKYYKITNKGKELFTWYRNNFSERFKEVKAVIDRVMYDLTGTGLNPPVVRELPEEYRSYFSKIISVKDLVRYVTLRAASKNKRIYMGEIAELLKTKFGWIASNGYLYDLSHEMEEGSLLTGYWESEKRTKRYLQITDEGHHHYKQIADSAAFQVREVQKYLGNVLVFLEGKELISQEGN